jgi:hypothetical protein
MQVAQKNEASSRRPVTLVMGDSPSEIKQPGTFRVCPLGIQLYSSKNLPEFELLEFRISIPQEDGTAEEITCTGVVVHSRLDQESSLYRVWVKFLDLPEGKRNRIQCIAKTSSYLCPYCENF